MISQQDAVLNQAIDELRKLPPVDPVAVARIVGASVAARAMAPHAREIDATPAYLPGSRSRMVRFTAIVGVAAAAGFAGFVLRDATMRSGSDTVEQLAPFGQSIAPVSATATELLPVPTQFVLTHPGAREVRLIGDFNDWGREPIRLTRDANGVWSATVPLVPGRHMYSFVVDDSVILDPRSPSATDPDFDVKRSVVIVGRP